MKKITVSRPINGISINGNENLLDENNNIKYFDSKEDAIEYLAAAGLDESVIEAINFNEVDVDEFTMPVVYQMWGTIKVIAQTLEEAEQIALDGSLPYDAEYIDESIEIDKESSLYGKVR